MNTTTPPRVAYFVSEYPCVSHTFIRREIDAVRARGVDLRPYSIHQSADPIPGHDVVSIFPITAGRLLETARSLLVSLVRRPRRTWRTWRLAVTHRLEGARNLLWSQFYFLEALLLASWLERDGIEHLHVHFANAGAHIGILVHELTGLPWSMTLHGACDFEFPAGPLLPEKLEQCRFVAFASWYGRSQAMRTVAPEHWAGFQVVRCGIEPDRITRREPKGERASGERRLYSVGRLSPEKGQSVLLKAMAIARDRHPELRLHLVGDGPSRAELEALRDELELGDRVVFHGAVTEQEVLEHLQGADFLAMGSFMEGIPLALMEAMASGVPVIAPRIAGIPELIQDGEEGFLFHPAHWEDLAAAIDRVMALDDDALEKLVERADRKVRGEFAIDRNAGILADLFARSA